MGVIITLHGTYYVYETFRQTQLGYGDLILGLRQFPILADYQAAPKIVAQKWDAYNLILLLYPGFVWTPDKSVAQGWEKVNQLQNICVIIDGQSLTRIRKSSSAFLLVRDVIRWDLRSFDLQWSSTKRSSNGTGSSPGLLGKLPDENTRSRAPARYGTGWEPRVGTPTELKVVKQLTQF